MFSNTQSEVNLLNLATDSQNKVHRWRKAYFCQRYIAEQWSINDDFITSQTIRYN